MDLLENKPWWNYIEADLQDLLKQSFLLLDVSSSDPEKFKDYSFVVFPAAKAFEGFLKKLFLDMGFISNEDYSGKRFRIGKALNPYLENDIRFESVYDRIVSRLGNKILADRLWNTWTTCRNLVFHWFPNEKNAVSLPEAEERLNMITGAVDEAVKECKIS